MNDFITKFLKKIKKKSYKYCPLFSSGINFYYRGLTFCNSLTQKSTFLEYDDNFLDNFLTYRNNAISNKCIPEACLDCKNLCDVQNIPPANKINQIEVYHWIDCNCACVYCSNRADSKLRVVENENNKVKGVTNIVPYLIKIKEKGLLDDNLVFNIVGGEITLLEEFGKLSDFIIENNYAVNIVSNGILCDSNVIRLLNANKDSSIIISLDCSNKEKYMQIKGVDKFDSVINTLKSYVKEIKYSSSQVRLKYIILEGLNDTKEQIDNWINLGIQIGIKSFFPSAEFCHSGKDIFSQHVCELYNYIKLKVNSLGDGYQICVHDFLDESISSSLNN